VPLDHRADGGEQRRHVTAAHPLPAARIEHRLQVLDDERDVAVEVEVQDGGPGRIRLSVIEKFSADSLHRFLRAAVAPGITAKTDGWRGYPGAPGVSHDPHVVGRMAAHVVLPWVHRVFSNLKTRALGVCHGLRRKNIQTCLDEFAFRFNRRRTRHAAFRTLLGIATTLGPLT
jgi:hypothetical protein